ncbi:MAG: NADH-quinone oxidoreductase subunit J family protein [Planctomycetota bacterium]
MIRKNRKQLCLAMLFAACVTTTALAQDDGAAMEAGVTTAEAPGGMLDALLFYAVGGAAVVSALAVCLTQNIVRMAVWLFIALGSVAVLYFQLAANFLGAIQLIVYAGGTLVLLVFGVMLTSKSPWVRFNPAKWELVGAGVVCVSLLAVITTILTRASWNASSDPMPGTALAKIGYAFMSEYLVPFEVAGVVLMIVMVGAAHLARQESSD